MNPAWFRPHSRSSASISSYAFLLSLHRSGTRAMTQKKPCSQGTAFGGESPRLCCRGEGKATAQNCGSLTLRISTHNVYLGCLFSHGCGDSVCRNIVTLLEHIAQLEEQVEKNEGGELGRGPAFPMKVYTVSQAGPSLPLRKA